MISFIINPVAGGAPAGAGLRRAEIAHRTVARLGLAAELFLTERRGHAHELAAAAVRRGDRLVVAWGGDGTVNEVGSALTGSSTMLGVVPAGSGNGLARELGVPRSPERAIAFAVQSAGRAIDVGELGGRQFFSVAGIGFDAHVAAAFDADTSGRRGLSSYVRITLREILRYECRSYRVNGVPATGALLLTFANSAQFGNGARIAPDARIDDGLLDLVVFEERTRAATLRHMLSLFTGRVAAVPGVSITRLTTAVVETDAPMTFHVDGEPVRGGVRLEARIHPRALIVAG